MSARWRNQPNERGLAGVCQMPRGYELREHGKVLLRVGPVSRGFSRDVAGWHFYGEVNGIRVNSADNPCATKEEAKAQADAWYRANRGGR